LIIHKLLAGSLSILLLAGFIIGESVAQQSDSSVGLIGSSELATGPAIAQIAQCATVRSWDGATQRGGDLAVNGGQYDSVRTNLVNNGVTVLPGVAGGSLSAGTLAGVDAFYWGTSTHVLTGAEATALSIYIRNGGWLILETDSPSSEQAATNSAYNALGLGNRVGATAGGNVGGTFENVVTATTVGVLGDFRGQSFAGSVARALDDTGHTLVAQNTVPLKTWVEYTVGSGGVLGLGDPYGFDLFQADNNDEAIANYVLGNHCRQAVGGEMIPLDATMILVAGAQYNAAWMIPIIVSAAGIGLLIQSYQTKLKHNSCPSCKLESEDIFDLGEKTVGKCDNPKCQVSLFFVE